MVTKVTNTVELDELVALLLGGKQARPICIVTIPTDVSAPQFDPAFIEAECEGLAQVFAIESGDLTRELQSALPENCHAFGGAALCYPIDFYSRKAAGVSGLYYPRPLTNLRRETQRIVSELWGMANSAGLIKKAAPGTKLEKAKVEAIFDSEVAILVRANGDKVSLRSELAFPGVPLDKILKKGQEVEGFYNSADRTFALKQQDYGVENLVKDFPLESVTLGLVKETDRQWAKVAIHPNLVFEVTKEEITGNPKDVVSKYYRVGEVYSFRVYKNPQGKIRLKSNDIEDDEEVLPALALVPNGEPWLKEGEGVLGGLALDEPTMLEETTILPLELAEFEASAEQLAAAEPMAEPVNRLIPQPGGIYRETPKPKEVDSTSLNTWAVNHYRGQILALQGQVRQLIDENNLQVMKYNELYGKYVDRDSQVKDFRSDLAKAKQDLRNSKKEAVSNPWDSLNYFEGYEDWFTYELNKAWIENYTVDDRKTLPLHSGKWSYSNHFFDNFNPSNLNPTLLRKVLRTVLELVTGRAAANGTERHPLTENQGGSQKIRPADGAKAMRMYVEENAASARRLHYWELPGGRLELSQVAVHDDYRIY